MALNTSRRKIAVRRKLGPAALIRRIDSATREAYYEAAIKAGKDLRASYRRSIKGGGHVRTGQLLRSIKMRRNKRFLRVRVGAYGDSFLGLKAKALEFGTGPKGGFLNGGPQPPRPYLIPAKREIEKAIPKDIRRRYRHELAVVTRSLKVRGLI